MSIDTQIRERSEAEVRRYMRLTVVDQLRVTPDEADSGRWRRYARCGQKTPAAPDPELFFPESADSDQTYLAMTFCRACPVWELCDREAAQDRLPGVWAGIFRTNAGEVAPLCPERGCIRYASEGGRRCHPCTRRARLERQREHRRKHETPEVKARLNARRRELKAAAKARREAVAA